MARYQIIVSYDGTNFYGSQRQGLKRTVQGELEKALTHIGWAGKSILMAGRTDTGVHASGQVAAFDLDWNHDQFRLLKAINSHLPEDLVVREISPVAASFHPRFDAVSRMYRFVLFTSGIRDPLRERYAWRVWPEVKGLIPIASLWIGEHDFSSFGSPTSERGSTIRHVIICGWKQSEDEWTFEIEADAFLYRMVRRLVYVQVAAAQGRVAITNLRTALDGSGKKRLEAKHNLPAGLAAACGLSLVQVRYDDRD